MDRLEAIYSHFRSFCARVGIEKPMATERWLATADHVVKEHFVPKPPVSTVPKHCGPRNPARDLCVALVKTDGLVVRQARATGRGGFYSFKSCRACGGFLHKNRFSKQGKSFRAVCKACDNSRRIKLRKRSTTKVSFPEPEAQR
jgi:hypothetical protein